MDLILTVFLVAIVVLLGFLWGLRYALRGTAPLKGKTNIPGPGWTLPFVGDAWRFAKVKNMKEFLDAFDSLTTKGDRALRVWMGPKLVIFVNDPKMGEAIMNSSKAVHKDEDVYRCFNQFSDGVFSRNGKGWRDLRRPLIRLTQPNMVMERYYDVFTAKAEELCQEVSGLCGKGTSNILKYMQDCLIDIVYETLMGIPAESKTAEAVDLNLMCRMTRLCMQLVMNPLYRFKFLMSFSALQKEKDYLQAEATVWAKRIHEKRKQILEKSKLNPDDPDFVPDYFMDTILQLLNTEPRDGDEYRVLSKPLDLIVAGYDTSSVALSTAVLYLAQHPEYQERAYQEQKSIMGDSLRAPTPDEIDQMEYLGMVYQETVRHVGVPGLFRIISSELVIDNYVFPEGTSVYLSIHQFNMKPEYWVKTKEFYPDNFSPENVAKRPKSAWLPFSGGARSCPGKAFTNVSAKIILSMLLRRFRFTTTLKYSDMEYEYMLMLESTKGYPVNVERRSVSAA